MGIQQQIGDLDRKVMKRLTPRDVNENVLTLPQSR
jgi:hypothetical protein